MPGGRGFTQQQVRMTNLYLNWCDDPAPGVIIASANFPGGIVQPYTGQVGSKFFYDSDQMNKLSDPTSLLYGGAYQYVKFKLGDTFAKGQLAFWDRSVADDLYQVTTTESNTTLPASLIAGVVINVAGHANTPGNYGFIQVEGRASVKFRAVLSSPGQTGSPVFAAAAGAGADNALADVLGGGGAATVDTVARAIDRFIGRAEAAPVGGAVSIVSLGGLMSRQ